MVEIVPRPAGRVTQLLVVDLERRVGQDTCRVERQGRGSRAISLQIGRASVAIWSGSGLQIGRPYPVGCAGVRQLTADARTARPPTGGGGSPGHPRGSRARSATGGQEHSREDGRRRVSRCPRRDLRRPGHASGRTGRSDRICHGPRPARGHRRGSACAGRPAGDQAARRPGPVARPVPAHRLRQHPHRPSVNAGRVSRPSFTSQEPKRGAAGRLPSSVCFHRGLRLTGSNRGRARGHI